MNDHAHSTRDAGSTPTPMTQTAIEDAEWANPANWYGGFLNLYYSRRDTRAFVPKRGTQVGGATLNFARGAGIGFLVGVGLFVILMYVLNRTDWLTPK
jgi:uncharacterized membrane protein